MKLDVKITNLGRLEAGTIKVRPITLLTGPNGTGKSFFSKTLYSLLNVVNKNAYHINISRSIEIIRLKLKLARVQLETEGLKQGNISPDTKSGLEMLDSAVTGLDELQSKLDMASQWDLGKYLIFATSCADSVDKLSALFLALPSLLDKTIINDCKKLHDRLTHSGKYFNEAITADFLNELLENFQIGEVAELVTFGQDKLTIMVDDRINIDIDKENIRVLLATDFVYEVSSLSTVVFFESPAYWKVSDALLSAKADRRTTATNVQNPDDILTGVPKYFYDLNDALKTRIKRKTKSSDEISTLTAEIKNELGGEFVFNGDNLSFKDTKSGREISKNLISFGMTNLGMIHALLKNNVITKGSFVFIDEPETNLHPNWQVVLMNTLIKLAEHEVNVVIATHSMDMIKALEIGMKRRKDPSDNDFMAINFLDTDGLLLDFESSDPMMQLAEARSALNSTYESLYFTGCADD